MIRMEGTKRGGKYEKKEERTCGVGAAWGKGTG